MGAHILGAGMDTTVSALWMCVESCFLGTSGVDEMLSRWWNLLHLWGRTIYLSHDVRHKHKVPFGDFIYIHTELKEVLGQKKHKETEKLIHRRWTEDEYR